jgi:hypothetical protein
VIDIFNYLITSFTTEFIYRINGKITVNGEVGRMWKESILRHYLSIYLKGLRTKITGQRFEPETSRI